MFALCSCCRHLLTCAGSREIKLWELEGEQVSRECKLEETCCVGEEQLHTDDIMACVWLPDGKGFVTGGADGNLFQWVSHVLFVFFSFLAPGLTYALVLNSRAHIQPSFVLCYLVRA